jgi:diguanylate cyclase (GGDEF)-like protein
MPLPGRATAALAGLVALAFAGIGFGIIAALPAEGRAHLLPPALAPAVLAGAALAGLAAFLFGRRALQAPPPADTLIDPLTGLPSHAGFRDRLEDTLALSRRQGWRVGVLVINLRQFRAINEARGRVDGDLALRLVAARLRQAVRREDVVARLAGDRFAVTQTALEDPGGALRLAERLAATLAEPLPLEAGMPVVTVDIGIAIGPEDGAEACLLLTHAEDALAAARTSPTPAIHCFAPEQEAALRERRRLEQDLREAVAAGSFLLHWQPQRRLSDGHLVGFEALLRWPHPTRGLVPPDEFIPLAETTGLIGQLGTWVLRQATAEAATWPGGFRVAVNLSPLQMRGDALPGIVAEALARSGLAPHRLELELTEGVLMQDSAHAARIMAELRQLGVSLALDDFGTGWSSLAYIRRFPIDVLKMDRGFIRDIDGDPRVEAVVGAILGLGRGLGIQVLAEGIETPEQKRRLAALGCEQGQGWLLGRPMPPEQVRALIAQEVVPQGTRSAA